MPIQTNARNITPDVIKNALQRFQKNGGGVEGAMRDMTERIDTWGTLLWHSPAGKRALEGSTVVELMAGCNQDKAMMNHLVLIDLGFAIAEELASQGKLTATSGRNYGVGFHAPEKQTA
jgi:hypothetical protein